MLTSQKRIAAKKSKEFNQIKMFTFSETFELNGKKCVFILIYFPPTTTNFIVASGYKMSALMYLSILACISILCILSA